MRWQDWTTAKRDVGCCDCSHARQCASRLHLEIKLAVFSRVTGVNDACFYRTKQNLFRRRGIVVALEPDAAQNICVLTRNAATSVVIQRDVSSTDG